MERKVAQTELGLEEYSAFAKIAMKKGLSIKDALREAAQRWTQEESGIDPNDSLFDIAAGRRKAQDWGEGSENASLEVDKLVYGKIEDFDQRNTRGKSNNKKKHRHV
jgi:hypothetical protein